MSLTRRWIAPLLALALILYGLPNAPRGPIGRPVALLAAGTAPIVLVGRTGASGANTFTTPAMTTTSATLLVAVVTVIATASPPTVSDSKSNTWTPLTSRSVTGQQAGQIFYVANPTVGSSHTFTVTGTAISGAMVVFAFSGVTTTSPFDQQNGSNSISAGLIQPGSITPGSNGELIVTGFTYGVASAPITIDDTTTSIFTAAASLAVSGTSYGVFAAWGTQATAAAINPTWKSLGTANCTAMIASFTAAAAASSGGETSAVFAGGS